VGDAVKRQQVMPDEAVVVDDGTIGVLGCTVSTSVVMTAPTATMRTMSAW
jgi:hypothetical protein